ncbi:MAG: ferritin-like domain-containing protein [Firmicutes bacterium]|nr:ferritin-like domain-containing protein [Bacillota bacterium]
MRTAKDMFVYFLNDMYSIESATLSLTRDLANKARDPEIKRDLEEHIEETRRQMRRLRSIVRRYGGKIAATKAAIFSILSIGSNAFQWTQTNLKQEELRMLYDGIMIENMEVGSYKALIAMAKSLDDMQSVSELLLSLEEEKAMSEKTEKQILNYLKQAA